jgi:hypothetical protein
MAKGKGKRGKGKGRPQGHKTTDYGIGVRRVKGLNG